LVTTNIRSILVVDQFIVKYHCHLAGDNVQKKPYVSYYMTDNYSI